MPSPQLVPAGLPDQAVDRQFAKTLMATADFRRPTISRNGWATEIWRRGWDSNPRYACTHNGFRDRPDRPLRHLSRATLISGRFPPGNRPQLRRQGPVLPLKSGGSDVDLEGSLRIFALLRRVVRARRV